MDSDGSENDLDTSLESAPGKTSNLKTRPEDGAAAEGSAPASPDDADIAELLRDGDRRGALMLCARRHGRSVGRLCMALLGSASEADDALQDTLLSAHASFASYRGDGSLRAWLFSIARRRCARILERRTTQPAGGDVESDGTPASGESADALLDTRRRAEAARALLAQVRPTEREALLLRYQAGLSFREVGEACGVDEAAARKRVSRALARLRKLVKE